MGKQDDVLDSYLSEIKGERRVLILQCCGERFAYTWTELDGRYPDNYSADEIAAQMRCPTCGNAPQLVGVPTAASMSAPCPACGLSRLKDCYQGCHYSDQGAPDILGTAWGVCGCREGDH